jgi:hypothetical protein
MPLPSDKAAAVPHGSDTAISLSLSREEWSRIIARLQWDVERKREDYVLAQKIDSGLAREVAKALGLPSRKTPSEE